MENITEALNLASTYFKSGRAHVAQMVCQQVLHTNPDSLDALHLLTDILHQTGQHEEALHYLHRALLLNPGNPAYHLMAGEILIKLGHRDAAVSHYLQSVKFDPDN